jgi:hypothetical protein
MAFVFNCPKCGQRLEFADEAAGTLARCAGCKQKLRLPDRKAILPATAPPVAIPVAIPVPPQRRSAGKVIAIGGLVLLFVGVVFSLACFGVLALWKGVLFNSQNDVAVSPKSVDPVVVQVEPELKKTPSPAAPDPSKKGDEERTPRKEEIVPKVYVPPPDPLVTRPEDIKEMAFWEAIDLNAALRKEWTDLVANPNKNSNRFVFDKAKDAIKDKWKASSTVRVVGNGVITSVSPKYRLNKVLDMVEVHILVKRRDSDERGTPLSTYSTPDPDINFFSGLTRNQPVVFRGYYTLPDPFLQRQPVGQAIRQCTYKID